MSNYQKVEISSGESGPYSEEQLAAQEEMADSAIPEEAVEEAEDERPDWLPEKFQSPEDLAKAYAELQAAYTKKNQGKSEEPAEDAALEAVATRDFSAYSQEFAENGELSDESIAQIESWGIPREMIDGYIEGQQAVMNAQFQKVYNEAGGEEAYKSMLEWAADNLEEGEQDSFNRAVMEGGYDDMMFAVRSLVARYKSSAGTGPRPLIQGSTNPSGASGSFRSLAELTSAMKDPRYAKDPAYRQDVQDRLASSNIL